MNRCIFVVLVVVALVLSVACGEEEVDNQNDRANMNNQPGGPCVEEYGEPIVLVTAVTDADDGAAIGVVEIWEIRRGESEVQVFGETLNLTEGEAGVFSCEVPCGFGSEPAEYTFWVGAEGYEPVEVSVEAEYEVFVGGCPSFNDGGTEVQVELAVEE